MNQHLRLKFVFNFNSLVSMKSMGSPIHSDLHFWLHYLCVISYMSTPRTKHNAFLPINWKLIRFYRIAKKPWLVSTFRMLRNIFFFNCLCLYWDRKMFGRRNNRLSLDSPRWKPQLNISSNKILSSPKDQKALPWASPLITRIPSYWYCHFMRKT